MGDSSDRQIQHILGRRSVRVYTPGEIGDEAVNTLLRAAMAAPSAMTKDPWRFVVVRDNAALGQLAGALPGGKMLPAAALAIVVCGDLEIALEQNLSFMLQDCSAATQNLLLAVHALGLGGCWVGVHPSENAIREVKRLLNLPGSIVPIACVAIGCPGEQLEARTRFNPQYIHRERW